MRRGLRGAVLVAAVGLLAACTLSAANAQTAERSLLGIRIWRSWRDVLAKYGKPTRIEIGAVSAPAVGSTGQAGGIPGASIPGVGGRMTLPGMPGMGPMGPMGPGGPSTGGMMPGMMGGGIPMPGGGGVGVPGRRGPGGPGGPGGPSTGGMMPGMMGGGIPMPGRPGGPGMPGMPSTGGGGRMMAGAGMETDGAGGMNPYAGLYGTGGGPGMAGMPGGPSIPGMPGMPGMMGGGMAMGGGATAGVEVGSPEVTWVYEKGANTNYFLLNKDGRVIQIQSFGYKGGGVTSRGVRLGDPVNRVYSVYGWPDSTRRSGDTLTLDYSRKAHVAFQLVDLKDKAGYKVVGITVALTEKDDI